MKIIKLILYKQWRRSKKYAEIIRKRGPEKYADYSADTIFESLLKAYRETAKLLWPKVWKYWRLWLVPKIFFEEKIQTLIAKFPVYKTEFDKLGRNDLICVRDRNGRLLSVKKKHFDQNNMQYIKPCEKNKKQ